MRRTRASLRLGWCSVMSESTFMIFLPAGAAKRRTPSFHPKDEDCWSLSFGPSLRGPRAFPCRDEPFDDALELADGASAPDRGQPVELESFQGRRPARVISPFDVKPLHDALRERAKMLGARLRETQDTAAIAQHSRDWLQRVGGHQPGQV